MLVKALVAFALLGAALSCGGDVNEAPAKCDALVATLCERVIGCANDGTTQAECEAGVKTTLPCAQADTVSDGYSSCISELQNSPCTVLLANNTINLPATCKASIIFR
jgi:hypothetical protein